MDQTDLCISVFHPVGGGTFNCLTAHKKKMDAWKLHTVAVKIILPYEDYNIRYYLFNICFQMLQVEILFPI